MAAAGLLLFSCQKNDKKDDVSNKDSGNDTISVTKNNELPGKQCYLQATTSKSDKTISDSLVFTIDRHEGDSIWGEFNWKPAEKDKKLATYKGILKNNKGAVVANSNAEGMNYNEEVLFTITDTILAVAFGEMVEGKDGIWRYKDKSKTSNQVLNKVNCK
jgi:hypothetical protein